MNYEKLAEKINSVLNFELIDVNMNNLIKVIQEEHEENIRIKVHGEQGDENSFLEAAKPLMKYLCENYHPHVTVIIDGTRAQLVEGLKTVGCDDYIRD